MDAITKLYEKRILAEATADDVNRVAKQHPDLDRSVIQHYSDNADPKPGKGSRYLDWAVKGHVNGQHAEEDAPRIKDALTDFEKYKGKLEQKDINQYKHVSDIENAVAPHKGIISKTAAAKDSTYWENPEHHEKIFDNGKGLKVYHTKTKEASQAIYGGGHSSGGCHTSWCTAARSEYNRFDAYNKKGENPLYQIHTPDGKVYQDEFSGDYSGGLRNAADNKVERADLVKENPDLNKVKAFQGKDIHYSAPGPELDKALHNEIEKGNYTTVLNHASVKPEHLTAIVNKTNAESAIFKAMEHPKGDESTVSAAIGRSIYGGDDLNDKIIHHPKFNSEHADRISKISGWNNIKTSFFNSDKVKPEHIENAIASDDNSSHQLAAQSKVATDEQRERLFNKGAKSAAILNFKNPELISKHYAPGLESAVSGNLNTPSDIISKAYNATGMHNKHDLAMHRNAPASVISDYLGSADAEKSVDLLKKQKNVDETHVKQAYGHKNMLIRQAAVRHPLANSDIHNDAINNPSFHGSISVSPSASSEHLDQLSKSKHDFIRGNVAANKNTSKETLQALSTDSVKDVADAATKQLKKRK